jgi:hypothetical protein
MAEEETPAVEEVVTEVVEEPTAEETPAEPEVVEEVVVEQAPAAKSKSKKTVEVVEVVEEVVEIQAVEEPIFNEVVAAQAEAIANIPTMMNTASGTKLAMSSRVKR